MVMDGFGNGNCAVGNLKSVLVKDINVPTIFDFHGTSTIYTTL